MTAFSEHFSAPSAELSIAAAMGGFRLAPSVLDGVLTAGISADSYNALRMGEGRLADGAIAAATVENGGVLRRGVKTLAKTYNRALKRARKEAGDILLAVVEPGTIVEWDGDVAEVSMLVEDVKGGVWVRLDLSEGGTMDVPCDRWAELGDDVETELLTAWDMADIRAAHRALVSV